MDIKLFQDYGRRVIENCGKVIAGKDEVIRQVAEEKRVLLLDTAEVYRGEDGQLPGEMTSDGCHFKAKYYKLWAEYLRSHVVAPEDYLNDRGQEIA